MVVPGVQDEQARSDDAENMETHLEKICAVMEQGHSREHNEEFQNYADQEHYRNARETI